MATLASDPRQHRPVTADHRFFLGAAIAMALVIVAGFSVQLAMGRSSFAAPVLVHVHAVVFFGWVTLYVVQNALVATGNNRLHRRLGWIGAGWAAAMVVVGTAATALMVRAGRAPFFFEPAFFLFMNTLSIIAFAALTGWAIRLRKRTDWHRRLMLCGTAIITGPAWGRLMPMPLLIPNAAWYVFVGVIAFPIAGMIADKRRRGSVHPAWWWGTAVIVLMQLSMGIVAHSPVGLAIYDRVVAGGPGSGVDPYAYPPPPEPPPGAAGA
ncbi:MAG: hypothetical protein V4537_00540 [Pseudomonadota bacterium]